MSKVLWTAKTRRGMKKIVDAGYAKVIEELEAKKATKAEREEVENAKIWLQQETAGE